MAAAATVKTFKERHTVERYCISRWSSSSPQLSYRSWLVGQAAIFYLKSNRHGWQAAGRGALYGFRNMLLAGGGSKIDNLFEVLFTL